MFRLTRTAMNMFFIFQSVIYSFIVCLKVMERNTLKVTVPPAAVEQTSIC